MSEPEAESESKKNNLIYLTLLNGTGYIFNVDDYMKLRTEYRIIGNFMGTSPSRGCSINAFAIPVELTKYETQLVIENKIALLLSKKESLLKTPTTEETIKYQRITDQRIEDQENALKEEKIKDTQKNIEKILAGKRKKLLENGVPENDINLNPDEVINEIRDNITFDRNNALLEIPVEHFREHYGQIHKYSANESIHYRVFKNLWQKGKYVTCGEAFGADFILYPGDPMLFHASHMIVILDKPSIKPLELIRKCRLSVIVNKILLFAYETENHEIQYQTISWEGCMEKLQYNDLDDTLET